MVILPPVTLLQPKVSSLHNRSHFPQYKSYFSPCKKLVKYCSEPFVLMLELDWFWTYASSDLLTNAASTYVCLHLVTRNIILQLLHQQHQHGIKIIFVNKTTIMYNLVSIFTLLEIQAHFKIVFIKQMTITYNLISIYTLLEIWAHFECIKMVFIKQMTTTWNLVSIYTLLKIRVHFECINNISMVWGTERD